VLRMNLRVKLPTVICNFREIMYVLTPIDLVVQGCISLCFFWFIYMKEDEVLHNIGSKSRR
jgi:hypothetical protein